MVRTIRTCSILALAIALPAQAREASPLALYVQARLAEGAGQGAAALNGYAAALAADPQNARVARHAYREALEAGDFPLALRAARVLDKAGGLPVDGQVLLYLSAVNARDWGDAQQRLQEIADNPGLSFLAPLLGDWLALAGRGFSAASGSAKPNAYRTESQALIAIAEGNVTTGIDSVQTLWTTDSYRQKSLRIAAAATLARRKLGGQGVNLLVGQDEAALRAKTVFARNQTANLAVDTPARGAAFILARISGDLIVESSSGPALTIARLAQFADPANPRIRLNVAGALSARKRHNEALALTNMMIGDPVYGDDAASFRIEQLEALDRGAEALAEAQARASRSANDAARVADIQVRNGDFKSAATLYRELLGKDPKAATTTLAAADALVRSGDWPNAQPLFEQALKLAPNNVAAHVALARGLADQGQLDRAEALAARALILQPDDSSILSLVGTIAVKQGRYAQAIPLLEQAVLIDDRNAEQSEALGDAYWYGGRKIEARYAWAAAKVTALPEGADRLTEKISRGLP